MLCVMQSEMHAVHRDSCRYTMTLELKTL